MMKKNALLFVLLACALFALIIPASAQTELPAIDETEAAGLLGRWYMNMACDSENSCMEMAELGASIYYDVNADNTITIGSGDEALTTLLWYMEDGNAYSLAQINDNDVEVSQLLVGEEGVMVSLTKDGYVIYTREEPVADFSEEVAADSTMSDFTGEWHVKGMVIEGKMIPSQKLGNDIILLIDEESFLLSDGTAEEAAYYIMEEGKLYAVIEGTDEEGKPTEENVMIELHEDGTLFLYFEPDTENETAFVFSREKNVYGAEDLVDAVSTEVNEAGGLSGLMDSLTSGEGFDINGLVQRFIGGEGFDINGLIQQITGGEGFDVSGMMQQITGGEGFDINGLMQQFTGGEEFDLSGLMSGLTSGETGSFDLSGLMDMFGHGN